MYNEVVNSVRASGKERAAQLCRHVITSEYPPQSGGVSDYTHGVATGLAAEGDEVHVWCPACPGPQPQADGVVVHRELGSLTPADLRRVGRQLDQYPSPRHILVQWVPHGYGYRSMNLAFCWWLRNRAVRHRDRVEIMVHEPYLTFRADSFRQSAAAFVHRLMTMMLLHVVERVWVSIPEWERRWRPYALGRRVPFQWLPVASNIPVAQNPSRVQEIRRTYNAGGNFLVGHFGTYGWPIACLLEPILTALDDESIGYKILLMGKGSKKFHAEFVRKHPRLVRRMQAAGALSPEELSYHLAACDVLVQPYPDGASSRRGSLLAGLSHGKPIVTTEGPHSEPFWKRSGALALAPAGDTQAFVFLVRQLQSDPAERARMGEAARMLYQERFDISYTIAALRQTAICAS